MVYFKLMNIFLISADNESTEIRKLNGRFFLERRISLIKLLKVLIYSGLVWSKSRKDWSWIQVLSLVGLRQAQVSTLRITTPKIRQTVIIKSLTYSQLSINQHFFFAKSCLVSTMRHFPIQTL